MADAEEDEERPFPSEGVDGDAEDEPVDQLGVGEEIKGRGWGAGFDEARHVDPFLHPVFLGTGEGVDKEDEEEACVDTDVPGSDLWEGVGSQRADCTR